MKTLKFILLIFVFFLFCNAGCKYEEGQRFIIQNNSEKEITVVWDFYFPMSKERAFCLKPTTKFDYQNLVDISVNPHSMKNFERNGGGIGEYVLSHPKDTLYIGVFYRVDMDTMSCEEFKQKFPLKHEWRVTLADMEICNWTLAYP